MTAAVAVQAAPARDLEQARRRLLVLLSEVRSTCDTEWIKSTRDSVRLTREWAKTQRVLVEMRLDLLRLEVTALRRIIELGGDKILHGGPSRGAARHLATYPDPVIEEHIIRHAGCCATAIGLSRHISAGEYDRGRDIDEGREFATDPAARRAARDEAEQRLNEKMSSPDWAYPHYRANIVAAMAAVIDEFAGDRPFTISEIVVEVSERLDIPEGFREGVGQILRTAIRNGPTVDIDGIKAPRFVTCPVEQNRYARVPFERATVDELESMIAMRDGKLAEDVAAIDRLRSLAASLRQHDPKPDEVIGSILARVAPAGDVR